MGSHKPEDEFPNDECEMGSHMSEDEFSNDKCETESYISGDEFSFTTKKSHVKLENRPNLPINFEKCGIRENRIPWLVISDRTKGCSKKTWNYKEMFQLMIGNNITMLNYETFREKLTAILQEFHIRHEKFHYFAELQTIPSNKKNKKCEKSNVISLHQFQKYFSRVFHKVIPLSLFGSHRNVKKLRKVLKAYYIAPINKTILLDNFVVGLNISSVEWLRPIRTENTRWSVFLEVIKWMFEKYFSSILATVFRVQKSLLNQQKIFIRTEPWCEYVSQYAKNEVKKGTMKHIKRFSNNQKLANVPPGRLLLIAKPIGGRPICVIKYNKIEKAEANYLKTLLQQVYSGRYERQGLNAIYGTLGSYAEMNEKNNKNPQLNIVSCDVRNAFGSIDQTKLFDIVNSMFNDLPDLLQLQWFKVTEKFAKPNEPKVHCCRWFSFFPTPFRIESQALRFKPIKEKIALIGKEMLLLRIKDYIFNQTFQFMNEKYVLTRGVSQGSILSPILSEIYYAEITDQAFRNFKRSGKVFRFADDFLYFTEDQNQAQRFLAVTRKGIPEYDCSFNLGKTQTNVKSPFCRQTATVDYLGYRMNADTLDVNPVYNNIHLQYAPVMSKIAKTNSVKIFSDILTYNGHLKLHGIILDPKINSMSALVKNIEMASEKMALRAVSLISAIFVDPKKFRNEIMEKIKIVAKTLGFILRKHLFPPGESKRNDVLRQNMRSTIWKSIFRVFKRNAKLREIFCKDIKLMICGIKKKAACTKV